MAKSITRRRAIVFDLDGTLVDSAPDLVATLNNVLTRRGRAPIPEDMVRVMIGDGIRALVLRGLEASGGLLAPAEIELMAGEFLAHYEAHIADLSRPFPGVVDALTALTQDGCVLGVCTNKIERFSVKLLKVLGIAQHFAAIVGGDSLAVRKPAAGHLLGTIERMGAARAGAVMVGDSGNDVAAARAAGIAVIAVSFGYTNVPAAELGADKVIHHFKELAQAVAELA
jgi:phosphoglycolate phosphatase